MQNNDNLMFKAIYTDRLVLRRLEQSDAKTIFAYRKEPEVIIYQNWEPNSVAEIQEFINGLSKIGPVEDERWFQIGIILQKTGELIGDCGMFSSNNNTQQVEIGITVNPIHQKNGYAKEAIRSIINYLFIKLKLHRIYASIDPCNTASIALFSSIGFREEAHFKESLWFKDRWVDDIIYAILDWEWLQSNK